MADISEEMGLLKPRLAAAYRSTTREKPCQAFVPGQEQKEEASHLGSSPALWSSYGSSPYLSFSCPNCPVQVAAPHFQYLSPAED